MKSPLLRLRVSHSWITLNLWLAILLLWLVTAIWAAQAQLQFVGWTSTLLTAVVFAGIWFAYGASGRSDRIAYISQAALLWLGFGVGGTLLTYCAATLNFPLYDERFVALDAVLGFHWPAWFRLVQGTPLLEGILAVAYGSFIVQIGFSIIYFSHLRQPRRIGEILWIALVAVVITSVTSGVFPARGAFEYFGVAQYARHLTDLTALREAGADSFAIAKLEGIITMPSYHAAMAIYLTYAFRSCGRLSGFIALLNVLMLLSVLSHGGHYLVDLIAGVLVAVVAIAGVRGVHGMTRARATMRLGLA